MRNPVFNDKTGLSLIGIRRLFQYSKSASLLEDLLLTLKGKEGACRAQCTCSANITVSHHFGNIAEINCINKGYNADNYEYALTGYFTRIASHLCK